MRRERPLDNVPGMDYPGMIVDDPGTILIRLAEAVGRDPQPRAVFAEVGLGPPVITQPQPLVELFFVLAGACTLVVGDRSATLASGDLALINAHQGNHGQRFTRGFRYGCVSLSLDNPALRRHPLLAVRAVADLSDLVAAAREAAHLVHAPPAPLSALRLKAALLRVLLLAATEFEGRGNPAAGDPRLLKALAAVHERHRDPDLGVDDLADAARLSPEHLGRLFRRAFAVSPMQYVLRLRLERARGLLSKTGLGVKEVAHLVGFRDAAYFSRSIRRATGVPPSQLRRPPAVP